MPSYDYKCPKCEGQFEEQRTISTRDLALCPRCGEIAERLLSAPAFKVKGGTPKFHFRT